MVLLKNGDALEGVLTALDAAGVTIEVDRRPVTVDLNRTAAVALSSDLTEAPKPKGVYARLVLDAPATRSTALGCRCPRPAATAGRSPGPRCSAPRSACRWRKSPPSTSIGGKAVYLSELKPSRYEYFPYLDERWEWSRDADVTGLDLRLGGSTYDRGVGLHSHGRLSYAVPKDCRRFDALVGLDDRTGREGSVRVRVLADGKPLDLGGDRELTAGAPLFVGVDVAGAKELTLEVDFGEGGPVQDHVDWVDARFVK